MTIWLGAVDAEDTGIEVPSNRHLGSEIVPSVDLDYSQISEPSKDLPSPQLPDVPDVD
jgi:hypothetical protein